MGRQTTVNRLANALFSQVSSSNGLAVLEVAPNETGMRLVRFNQRFITHLGQDSFVMDDIVKHKEALTTLVEDHSLC